MSCYITFTNLAHFEKKAFIYLISNIFPELDIIDTEYNHKKNSLINKISNQKINICISLNLDNYGKLKLNGIRQKDTIKYDINNLKDPILFFTGESWDVDVIPENKNNKYLLFSPYKQYNNDNVITIPWIIIPYIQFYLHNFIFKYKNKNINREYLLSYCARNKTKERTKFMELFIDKTLNKDKIICLGSCTFPECKHKKIDNYRSPSLVLVDEYSKSTFVLAMENTCKKGYITEKLLQAFISGSIPIYWGDDDYAKKIFNPKAFISINDYNNFEECIDYILNLKPEEIESMLKEPMFVNNIIPDIFDITNFETGIFGNIKQKVKELYS